MTCGSSRHTSARGDNEAVRPRIVASLAIGVLTLPVIFFGLIDPLEGGIALVLALGLGALVRLVSGVHMPRLTWISMVATLGVGLVALVLAMLSLPPSTVQEVGPEATAPNPLDASVRVLVWIYRLGVLVVLAGGVLYLVRLAQQLRGDSQPRDDEVMT